MAEEEHLVVGRYRLFRRIGSGAMGVVWEGRDERLNRPVAIKKLLLHPDLLPRKAADAVARCLREGRIAARLNHPNAIAVFDVVDEDDVPCLVMEYLPSRSLATVMAEEGTLPPVEAAAIGAQVATALAAAHAAGIVHRDITPGNVLIGEDGSVKITDFGISRAIDDVTVTKTGMFAGTPAYMAPEVALGADPTPASDVFALGSTLYTAVEGEPPFGRAANTLGVLHAVAGGKINPPSRSGPLTDVLMALLRADPEARPTAAEARDLLAAVGRGEVGMPAAVAAGVAADRTEADRTELVPLARESAPAARARGTLAVAGVFVVALVAVGLWLLGGRDGFLPAEEQAPADGTVHTNPGPTSVSGPVAPVRVEQPIRAGEQPRTSTSGAPTTATSPAGTSTPPATTDAPPPSTGGAVDPTTDTSTEPPPSSEAPASEPPPTAAD
ncbi:serine/threonine-protein kinase [Actinophytocola sp.]|uniref:serine/threonine-protein kinase n=1 Tax=Actinophytocola sp. TaxID=1872138 RepID=UPI002D6FA7F6|nr:protein kinase [Actinophytocola sp.]HYQ65374.1 protein kinase [Actinophytocola sp.]